MKRKIRKMIVAGITACVIMVPTIASAYSSEPDWGWHQSGSQTPYYYGWASYDHHMCYVTITSGSDSASDAGWCYAETKPILYGGWINVDHHFD